MASHIKKFSYGVLFITGLTMRIFLAEGQSTVGGFQNGDQQMDNGLERVFNQFESYLRESIALTKSVRSDIQNLKGEIELLKNRIEDHDNSTNSASQVLKRTLEIHDLDINSQFLKQCQQQGRCKCPEGFNYSVTGFPKCYAALKENVNWHTAQVRCRQLHNNAQLAVIINSREQQIITDILQNLNCRVSNKFPNDSESHGVNAFWIGARRREISNCNSTMEWTSNNGKTSSSILYSNWAPEEPNCSRNIEACASLNKHSFYKWNDLMCTWSICPLCEVSIDA